MPSKLRQVAVYPDPKLLKRIQKEALRRRRMLGPTVLEIVREYFTKEKMNERNGVSQTS